jgi:hypothetical protein
MFHRVFLFLGIIFFSLSGTFAQSDVDYIRYSKTEIGGSPRFLGMGGAMGALGADMSCASYNPAGIGIFTRFDINYGFGFLTTSNHSDFLGQPSSSSRFMPNFSTFGLVMPYPSKNKQDVRNLICYNINQLVNFNSRINLAHSKTKATLNRDMLLNISDMNRPNGISPLYEGLGFNSYLLDFDSVSNKFFSFCDTAIPVKLNRTIILSGRINESTFSFAQSIGDEWYWGIGFGIQNVRFENDMIHSEFDDQNKMQIVQSGTTATSTYLTPPPFYYPTLLGFKQTTYREYYKTLGKGYNLKVGFIYRQSPELRMGIYAHTPTYFDLSDEYSYSMKTVFDGTITPMEAVYPPDGKGLFAYSVRTPWKLGGSVGYIFMKKVAMGFDAEWLAYNSGRLNSEEFPSAFDGVNQIIGKKYKSAFNFRLGAEYNLNPFFFRAGYIQIGNPYGKMFSSTETVHIFSAGFGFRMKYFYMDFVYQHRLEQFNYYPYIKTNEFAKIQSQRGMFNLLLGYKI